MKYSILILLSVLMLSPVFGKISGDLSSDLNQLDKNEDITVLVHSNGSDIEEEEFTYNVEVKDSYPLLDTAVLRVKSGMVEGIDQNPYIERIGPDHRIQAMLSESRPQIDADFGDSFRYNGSNVSVAVMDSGIASHPAIDVAVHRDFTGEGRGDENGHGTHVAGIVASQDEKYRGISPGASIYDLKVLDSEGSGKGSEMLAGLNYAVKNDLDVVVMSLGSLVETCNGKDILSRAVDQASRSGVVIVAAAGNQGPEEQTITSPGCSREAITVGALEKSGRIAPYSSRGLTEDGRVKPDVVAPGSNIASASIEGGFIRRSGTSMAAPHVAGQAAILLSSGLESGNVKNVVINSSKDLGYPKGVQGAGRIDVRRSLNFTGVEVKKVEISWFQRLEDSIFQALSFILVQLH